MKKLLLINCYFGNLPSFFDFYVESVKFNPTVDFLLVTDDKTPRDYPKNLIVKYTTFEQIREQLKTFFDFEIALESSYKLCDFRPVYGKLFYDLVKNYDFWGYADIDLIFGDIRSFITEEILLNYDKILTAGHFTLVPVDQENLNFYTNIHDTIDYKKIYQNPVNFAFDEWPGMTTLYTVKGKRVYNNVEQIADISYHYWYFLPSEESYRRKSTDKKWHTHNIVYLFDKGKLYSVGINAEGGTYFKEMMYVHFQKRKVAAPQEVKDKFLMLPPGKIVTEFEEITPKFLKKHAKEKKFYFPYLKLRIKNLIKKLKGKNKK